MDDDGARRLGDIVYKHAVVEVKRHKTISMVNVPCVRDLALAAKKPWALFEFKTGYQHAVKITVDKETAAYIAECLDRKWRSSPKTVPVGKCATGECGHDDGSWCETKEVV